MLDRQGGLQRICYVAERMLCGVDSERSTKTQEETGKGRKYVFCFQLVASARLHNIPYRYMMLKIVVIYISF